MKKMINWMLAAVLICVVGLFAACSKDDNASGKDGGAEGIAMIVKNGDTDYWRQVETEFRSVCREKGLEAYYYATSGNNAYEEQVAAVAELRKLGDKVLKGIIFSPCYGKDGESAEAEVAALAQECGIPVVIIDSPVSASGPLASCPYFGTDNAAAGEALAEQVMAERVAVFALTNNPGMERAEAFKRKKPNAAIFGVDGGDMSEVLRVLGTYDYDDFVFFNGSLLVNPLLVLKANHMRIYTFDVYDVFLDELMAGTGNLKGIMAQNTFEMARKSVEAVLANTQKGEIVPAFYITDENLGDERVKPFLAFYNKTAPAVIDGLAEKILGKWIEVETDGQPAPTRYNSALTFLSASEAQYSSSRPDYTETQLKWSAHRPYSVKIAGNKVTLTGHPETEPELTLVEEFIVSSISATEMVCKYRHTTIRDGQISGKVNEKNVRMVKTNIDYRYDIVGIWEGLTTEGLNVRWNIREDGTYVYAEMESGGEWMTKVDEFNEYFADGYLFCARWKNADDGRGERRQWWEIATLSDDVMVWMAANQEGDDPTETVMLRRQ